MTHDEYARIDAINISTLKEMWAASPKHYQHALRVPRADTPAFILGRSIHCAVLEPEHYAPRYLVVPPLDKRTKEYKIWRAEHAEDTRERIPSAADRLARNVAAAVRYDSVSAPLLRDGMAEVPMTWTDAETGLACKGRADWLHEEMIVGLKTTSKLRHGLFRAQAAQLGYHLQWAFYHDGWMALNETEMYPTVIEIVVETAPPHDVVVYRIPDEVLDEGRIAYRDALQALVVCQERGIWLGVGGGVENVFQLPAWAIHASEELDITTLDWELEEQA